MRIVKLVLAAGVAIVLSGAPQACTLWGASGDASEDGTLLAKNRDWRPDHVQSLRLRHPGHGFAYLGLYADNGSAPGLKAGVNERGLALVGASASSLPRDLRLADSSKHAVLAQLLREFASLDQVEAGAGKVFSQSRPMFLLMADATGLMQVEVGQHGRYRLTRQSNGTLAHTNHYFDASLLDIAQQTGESSRVRLGRIQSLLAQNQTHTLREFEALSQDRHDGADNSLWRNGKEYTLAAWQMALPKNQPPKLHLVLANPGQRQETADYLLDAAFWAKPEGVLLP
ncbi:carcinine hydrolase/isopenicillin-N N-acyltransferase family protein [Chromobacterium sp. IIBBL 290-4]|uniref:carcinine hydrolase/isopenicillin-N N-acyltransferase family protein n=1 Tax=Chromobacterium sp. IIBBL 290-4 TaxID=2953890 RepID=UPI0020B6EF54|nr:carcinine hydrolase/isopenicillin-N N-acyltransferase family protein [Chromobacterium sp. IIBBL 290-4]UTH73690.1 C45 family peptidase [Chromobacterium sp. IIBBL 290-4]